MSVIEQCLDVFCISLGKTRIYFSCNVNHVIRDDFSQAFHFSRIDDLGKYLGVPLLHKQAAKALFKLLLDKAINRLSTWKTSSLSLAGRLTLVSSVVLALPVYTMQTTFLPWAFAKNWIKKGITSCGLIWSIYRRKFQLVDWASVCKPKVNGGLGLTHAREMNIAFYAEGRMGTDLPAGG